MYNTATPFRHFASQKLATHSLAIGPTLPPL